MAFVVKMPKMGGNMEYGTISEWVKQEGKTVERGDLLFTFETDKTTMDYKARKEHGIMLKVMAEEDEQYDIGTPLCIIGEEGENISEYL